MQACWWPAPGAASSCACWPQPQGDAAQGKETEAEEIVGQISTGGTVSFIVFAALLVGLATGVLYMLVKRWLPDGRLDGLVYGALLLVVGATR